MTRQLFTQQELDRIAEAVHSAEQKTSGEIVPYFVERSDRYDEAAWRGGALSAALALVLMALYHLASGEWYTLGPTEVGVIALGAMGIGVLVPQWFSAMKRILAGNELMEQRVAQRAAQAFIAEEVFNTRNRTGILLFLSHLERKVLVVGDSGINTMVQQSEWEDIVARMTRGINEGKAAEGLIDAIRACGTLLEKRGVKRSKRDRNELSNTLRMGKKAGKRRRRS